MRCSRCDWYKGDSRINCLPFFGNPKAEVVFLAEAFGASEAASYIETGIPEPLIGKAGKKFDQLLELAVLVRSNVALMNAMRCFSATNETPSYRDLDACHIHTLNDLNTIDPKLIVVMGASALYQVTGFKTLKNYLGKVIFSDKIQRNVFVTYHPMAAGYDPGKWEILVDHFKQIPILIGEKPSEIKHYQYEFIQTVEEFDRVYSILLDAFELYLDVESTGLNPYKDDLTLIQIGTGTEPIFLIDPPLLPLIKDKLKYLFETKKINGQDYAFDVKFLYVKAGIFPKHWGKDFCLAEFAISGMKHNDLTYLTSEYVPESAGYDDVIKQMGGPQNCKDPLILRQYGSDDIGVLPTINKRQTKLLLNTGRMPLYENIMVPCNKVLTKMSLRGIKYDLTQLWKVDSQYEKKANRALLSAMVLPGIPECEKRFGQRFNPQSIPMVRWLLIDYYGLPVLKTTNKGNPQLRMKEMEIYSKPDYNNKYCKTMLAYRSYNTIRANFLSGVVPKLVGDVAHTTYSLHATSTGRPNSKNPNLLNIPHDPEIKRMFIPRKGYEFIYADLSQIEVRVAAVYYGDSKLLEICNDIGKDFHSMICSRIHHVSYETVFDITTKKVRPEWEIRRRDAKTITFGILYGMGAEALAYQLDKTVKEAQQDIDFFYHGFPELKENIEVLKTFVIKYGYVDTMFGFRRIWLDHTESNHFMLREAVNHPIQGTAFALEELILIEVDKLLDGMKSGLVLQVYDSIVIESHKDETSSIIEPLKKIIEDVNKPYEKLNRVRVKADIKIGSNLGEV